MDDDEIKQYAMLVIDLRSRLETKAQEFLQAEQAENKDSDPQ